MATYGELCTIWGDVKSGYLSKLVSVGSVEVRSRTSETHTPADEKDLFGSLIEVCAIPSFGHEIV